MLGSAGMSTCPATVHFRMYPYATFKAETALRDSDDNPIDLTGYTALMHIRRDMESKDPEFVLTSTPTPPDPPSIELGGVDGTITLKIPHDQTSVPKVDPEGEVWVHDLLLTNPSGEVERTYQGMIVVVPGVTRP